MTKLCDKISNWNRNAKSHTKFENYVLNTTQSRIGWKTSTKNVLNPLAITADDIDKSMVLARRIDVAQLAVRWAMVAFITGGLIINLQGQRREEAKR
jgi:hypothetical protein